MSDYKVCILAAGVGSKLGNLSKNIHHSILPVNFKAIISHIIEKFPEDIEIVLAVGHKKETIKNYISLAHPNRKISYVDIQDYMGPGTGPGHSILQCKDHLQCPFIFLAADTLVLEEIPSPDKNWFGIAPVKKTEEYCTVKIKNNLVVRLDDKIKVDNKYAFIGLAGIKDYDIFFHALERNREIKRGEIQVSNGFEKLIERRLVPIGFTWFDTGSFENYVETNKNFAGSHQEFDFSKSNEFIYFVEDKVIKYFSDPEIARKRCERAIHLKGLCPDIEDEKANFYSYKKIDGQVLYNMTNSLIVNDFLHWAKLNLWKKKEISDQEKVEFKEACKKFYYDKTMKRLQLFYEKTGIEDTPNNVNGIPVPLLKDLLAKVDWESLFEGTPSNFHGDLQFDNILVTRDETSNLQKFVLLDWRQDFGGLVDKGDLYYDLSKLYGGVTLSYKLIKQGKFSFDMSGSSVYYNFSINNDLIEAKEEYESFLSKNGFDTNKIKIIRSLIFLNMCPLHNEPFDLMLYFMGKLLLYKALKEAGKFT